MRVQGKHRATHLPSCISVVTGEVMLIFSLSCLPLPDVFSLWTGVVMAIFSDWSDPGLVLPPKMNPATCRHLAFTHHE